MSNSRVRPAGLAVRASPQKRNGRADLSSAARAAESCQGPGAMRPARCVSSKPANAGRAQTSIADCVLRIADRRTVDCGLLIGGDGRKIIALFLLRVSALCGGLSLNRRSRVHEVTTLQFLNQKHRSLHLHSRCSDVVMSARLWKWRVRALIDRTGRASTADSGTLPRSS